MNTFYLIFATSKIHGAIISLSGPRESVGLLFKDLRSAVPWIQFES